MKDRWEVKLFLTDRAGLIVLSLVGLALRCWAAWNTNLALPNSATRLVGDEPGYDGLAVALLQGQFFRWPGRTPLYPIFLAENYLFLGHSYAAVLYVQALVGAAVVPLTYLLARRLTGSAGALISAGIVALHPALIQQGDRLYSEILYTPLLLLVLIALVWAVERGMLRHFFAAGAVLGLANLTRPTAALFPLFVPFLLPRGWRLSNRLQACVLYGLGMVALIAPWTFHNYRTYHTFLPLSVSTALLWQGSPEFYHLVQSGHDSLQVWNVQLNARLNGGHDPFTIEGDRYFTQRALSSIRNEPAVYAWYSLQKVAFVWLGNPAAFWEWPFNPAALTRYFTFWQVAGIIAARVITLAGLGSLLWLVCRRRLGAMLPLAALCLYFTVFHAVTYPEARFTEPLQPLLAIFTAASLSAFMPAWFKKGVDGQKAAAPAIEHDLPIPGELAPSAPIFNS